MPNDYDKSKDELVAELQALRQEVHQLRTIRNDSMWAEATFRDYLRFLDTLLNTIPNPVFYKNREGSFLGCNDIFANKILGVPKEKIFGRTLDRFPQVFVPRSAQFYRQKDMELLEKPGVQHYETQIYCANGQIRDFAMSRATYTDSMGKVAGIVGVMSDITELNLLKSTLLQNNLELGLLNRASQEFISSLNLDQVINNVLEEARQLIDVTACSAWLLDEKTNELVCEHTTDKDNSVALGWRLKPGQGVAGWVAQHGESAIVPDTRLDERHFKEIDRRIGIELRSILSVPLLLKGEVIGVLHAVDENAQRFGGSELRILTSLSYTAAIAIENARLYRQAQQDTTTKETLLREVNHRVKNNLAAIIGLLYAEQSHLEVAYQNSLDDLINRVQGLSTVHEMLSAVEWQPLRLSHVTSQIINSILQVIPLGHSVSIDVPQSTIFVTPEEAHELALAINELATNAVKYAISRDEPIKISAAISYDDGTIHFQFRDNGPGYPDGILEQNQEYFNVGLDLIAGIVKSSLRGQLKFHNDNGAITEIWFKTEAPQPDVELHDLAGVYE